MANSQKKLTKEERKTIIERLRAGESGSALAREYGISRQGVHHLKRRQEFLDGTCSGSPATGKRIPKRKLTEAEWERIKEQLRGSKPADHGLDRIGDDPLEQWNIERALQLAVSLTGRMPARSRMKSVLIEVLPPRMPWLKRPGPPVRLTFHTLNESQRADPDLAKYLLSDVYWRIQQREHELMIREYDRLGLDMPDSLAAPADDEPEDDPLWTPDMSPAEIPAEACVRPGLRVGKHKGNRQASRKSKRKKKRH